MNCRAMYSTDVVGSTEGTCMYFETCGSHEEEVCGMCAFLDVFLVLLDLYAKLQRLMVHYCTHHLSQSSEEGNRQHQGPVNNVAS